MKFDKSHQYGQIKRRSMPPSISCKSHQLTLKSLWLIALLSFSALFLHLASATSSGSKDARPTTDGELASSPGVSPGPQTTSGQLKGSKSMPANHRMEAAEKAPSDESSNLASSSRRHGRQYDGPMSASGTGNFAAISNDVGAYVSSSLPLIGYSSGISGGMLGGDSMGPSGGMVGYPASAYHDQVSMARGYPGMHAAGAYPPMPPFGVAPSSIASMHPGSGGLFTSSTSGGFPLITKGFDVAEIVCTAIAVAIGAVIVGAPFILLYLIVMNQMQASGSSALGPGGGSINLTGPTASTNVGGRKKRNTSFQDALFKQLSPLVNSEQVAQTFKVLMKSIAKYQTN